MSEQVDSFASEKKVTEWFANLIRNNQLYDMLLNKEETDVIKYNPNHTHIPNFSFDRLSRVANLNAANNVLDSLKNLEIISIDNSVSIKKGEILRPDIVCFNPEKRIFVMFELKREKLAERQALTELYAYEQEIRNIFPFIGNREIQTVVIAKDWDTLLEHAVSNYNSWSNKNCLAISIDQINDDAFKAIVKIPDDWYFRGVHGLPDECFQTFDLFVEGEFEDNEYVPHKIATFVDIIVKHCDRNDIHGFIMVWKNYSSENYGNWGITFCSTDPLAIFSFCKQNRIDFRESLLTKYVDDFYKNNLSIVSSSLEKIVSSHLPLLKEEYKVSFSNYMNWKLKLNTIKFYAKPIYYDFYGIISDYAINFISNPNVRNTYLPFLNDLSIDWHHPLVAPLIINDLNNNTPYIDGVIRCKDSFILGSKLGIYKYLVERYHSSPNENLKTSMTWAYSDILHYLVENQQLSTMFSTIHKAPPLLSNIDKYRLETIETYYEWVILHLLNDGQKIHSKIFEIGFNTAVIMSKYFPSDVIDYILNVNSNLQNIAKMLRSFFKETLIYLYQNSLLDHMDSHEIHIFNRVKFNKKDTFQQNISIIDNLPDREILDIFITDEFESFDKIYPSVFHTSSLEWNCPIDIDNAKKNIKQLFADKKYPAISINPNGQIGIILLDTNENGYIKSLFENINIDIETILVSNNAAANIHSKISWVELKKKFEGN